MEEEQLRTIIIIIIGLFLFTIVVLGFLSGWSIEKWVEMFKSIISTIITIFITWTIKAIPYIK